ncbi:CerR family C-terminal domain-containing protein [Humidesulfovibrio sp.]
MKDYMQDGTKNRLLRAASEVFSRRGLKNATVREICDLAKANVAAINYHFSGKDKLYVQVLKSYISEKESIHPVDEGVTGASKPEDMLRAFAKNMLFVLADNGDPVHRGLGKMLAHEFMEPSDIHDEVIGKSFAPKFAYLKDVVLRIYPQCDEHFAMRASAAIIGQCLLISYANGLTIKIGHSQMTTADDLDQMAAFIVEFSLGGLARLNELWRKSVQESSFIAPAETNLRGQATQMQR